LDSVYPYALALMFTLGGAAQVSARQVETTLEDFFLPGTQPETIADPILPSSSCQFCHGGYGEEAIHDHWKTSAMAQAGRDPLFHACMTIANQDADFAGDLCIRCHSAGGWLQGRSVPTDGSALIAEDYDGVTCSVCHRMVDPFYEEGVSPDVDFDILQALDMDEETSVPTNLHTGTFVIDPQDVRRGPFDLDADLETVDLAPFLMHFYEQSPFHRESQMCATCHDVSNPAYERVGGPTPATTDIYELSALNAAHPTQEKYDMFPVERTYSEWLNSDYALGPVETGGRFGGNITAVSTCQDCHMPKTEGYGCAIDTQRIFRNDVPLHDFLGAANWMLDAIIDLDISNAMYPDEADSGLTQEEVDAAKAQNDAFMKAASDMEVTFDADNLNVRVINETGHKLPTGYPEGRRMWLTVRFFDTNDSLITEYGAYDPGTAILDTESTKVYEAKLGVDAAVSKATGIPEGESFHFVVNNVRIKDNRIPPRGFENAAFEAVQAEPIAYTYLDGQYWDDTTFPVPCDAASVEVGLYYQTSSKEYVEFLRDENMTDENGNTLYTVWEDNGKSPPIEMDFVSYTLGDCNTNGIFDGCDIANEVLFDDNNNGVPDSCEIPGHIAVGGRYLEVVPTDFGPEIPVGILVTSDDLTCLSRYADENGDLSDTPVFRTVQDWGTVYVADPDIIPDTQYTVQIEFPDGSLSAPVSDTTWQWGDVDDNGIANFSDVQIIVLGFQGNFDNANRQAVDLFPCNPNDVINFGDIQQGVFAFQLQTFEDTICTIPCD
jgi:hypothetical protein